MTRWEGMKCPSSIGKRELQNYENGSFKRKNISKMVDDWKTDAEKWDNLCRKMDSKRMAFCGETQKEMDGEQRG